jgi:hypothetical protein
MVAMTILHRYQNLAQLGGAGAAVAHLSARLPDKPET